MSTDHTFPNNRLAGQAFLFPEIQAEAQPQPGPTVPALIELYLEHVANLVAAGQYSKKGLVDLRRDLRRFGAFIGHRQPSSCRHSELIPFLRSNPRWRSPSTKQRVVAYVVAFFHWLEREDRIWRNPFRRPNLRLPAQPRREATAQEYIALMRHGSREIRRVLFFLRNTGCRPSECLGLSMDQVSLELGAIELHAHKTRSRGGTRIIGLTPKLVRFLGNLSRQRAGRSLFLNGEGRPWIAVETSFSHAFQRLRDRLGLPADLTAYCFRHAYATEADECGVEGRRIDAQLGHSAGLNSLPMLSHYSKASKKGRHLREIAEEIERRRDAARRAIAAAARAQAARQQPA